MAIFRQKPFKYCVFNTLRILTGIHEYVFAANLNLVAIHSHGWVLADLARSYVILPAVPRASDDVAVHYALPQWASSVQAGVVDGIELAADIGQGNRFALNMELPNRSRRDFICLCCARKRHRLLSLLLRLQAPCTKSPCGHTNLYFLTSIFYRGSGVCATITPFLNSSTI